MDRINEWLAKLTLWLARLTFNATREDFYRELADAVKHNENVAVFLKAQVQEAHRYKESNAVMLYRRMLRRMNEKRGKLSHMLDTIVPRGDLLALAAVDEVKVLEKKVLSINFLADSVVRVRNMTGMVLGALQTLITMLPVFLIFAIMNAVVVIPQFEELMPVDQWPAIGKSLYWVSFAIRNFWYVLLFAAVSSIWVFLHSLDHWSGAGRLKADRHFPYSIYRDFHGNILLVRLAQLMQADIGLTESLQTLRGHATPWMRWHLHKILRNMDGPLGLDYAAVFDTGVFSRRLQKRVGAQARRGEFKEALVDIGTNGMDAVMEDMRKASGKLNRISLVICVLGILYFHLGIQITANDLISKARQQGEMVR